MKRMIFCCGLTLAMALFAVATACCQETQSMIDAIEAIGKAKIDLGPDAPAKTALTEIREVGIALTGSGSRTIYFARFSGKAADGKPFSATRVLYLTDKLEVDFVHSIGCGVSSVSLKEDRSDILVIGTREYDLTRPDWKKPLISQQVFC